MIISGEKLSKGTIADWQSQFPWLEITTVDTSMRLLCNICTKQKTLLKLSNVFAAEGSPNIQKNTISRHNDSSEHKLACEKLEKNIAEAKFHLEDDSNDESEADGDVKIAFEDKVLFNTVYFAAKSELPSTNVNGLLKLQFTNGVETKYQNLSWDTITSVQSSISQSIKNDIVNDINQSKYFGFLLDESTDIANEKRLSICVRFVKEGTPVTKFLCNVPIDDGCAHTIVNCVIDQMNRFGLDISKCVSLATDGASAMMGKHTGVGKQIESKYAPFCTQTHCVAHRLNLACSDTIKKNEFLVKFRDKFNALYHFMSGSSIRTLTLKKMQSVLQEPELSIKEPHSIRWLGLKNAVEAVFESYASVVATLAKFSEEKNPTAKGLYKYFNNYKVALVTAFIYDVHTEIGKLSCELQKQNLLFSEISPLLDGTLGELNKLETTDGPAVKGMKRDIILEDNEAKLLGEKMTFKQTMDKEFETIRHEYIQKMGKNMKDRLKKGTGIFDDLSNVFEPDVVIDTSDDESKKALDRLGTFYGYAKQVTVVHGNMTEGFQEENREIEALLDPEQLVDEWPKLRSMIEGSYRKLTTKKLCKRIIRLHKAVLPNLSILASIALCMQLTSVDCERSFSTQNRLKNKYRASLGKEKLDILLTITMLGADFGDQDLQPAIKNWLQKKRRKTRLFSEYKPRPKKQKTC